METTLIQEMFQRQHDHWWFQGRSRIVSALVERFQPRVPRGDGQLLRLCDVGCGTGANLRMLSRFGKVWGVEPCDDALQLARQVEDATVYPGGLPDELPFTHERFDVLTLTDVLEHVEQDQESVLRCAALLAPGGIIVATVPAYQWLWTHHDDHHRHFRRYRLGGFRKLFERAGLRVELASYCNSLLFPLMVTSRVMARVRRNGSRSYSALSLPPEPVNRALRSVFGSERHLLSFARLPFGGSVVCVARAAGGSPAS
jgi:2-polyprenyl-3-methyl-5-hydroxy-6-metoxy-1,4-benzoquinol methylase